MAYLPDYLCMISDNVGGLKPRVYTYWNLGNLPPGTNTPDLSAAIIAAGYFSDGAAKGMRVGDLVEVINDLAGAVHFTMYQVATVVAGAPPVVTVQVATAVP